jgi:hypothetical protein
MCKDNIKLNIAKILYYYILNRVLSVIIRLKDFYIITK